MNEMEVRSGSPQEDEFALLSLGARSPYEALDSRDTATGLKLSDPCDLSPQDKKRWRAVFLSFLAGVSAQGTGRPMILKSPAHGFRVTTLRELLPDARFVLVVRDPLTSFESVVRMWRKMFETYALGLILDCENIREAVIADRPRFEAKLASGTADLPKNRFTTITYESMIANPTEVLERLYERLELGSFNPVRRPIIAEAKRRRGYQAKNSLPSESWRLRISNEWASLLTKYATLR